MSEKEFQSTCPLRGTTCSYAEMELLPRLRFQSTCPLRGTTLLRALAQVEEDISIHVPLAGHDGCLR